MKQHKGKTNWNLLPLEVIEQIVKVLDYGAVKYAPFSWQNEPVELWYSAMMRHIVAWKKGEQLDSETQLHHLVHAMCNLMFIVWIEQNKKFHIKELLE